MHLTFLSDGMTTDDLYFKWEAKEGSGDLGSAVAIGDELIMSQFAVDGSSVKELTASYVTGSSDFSPRHNHDIFIPY